MNWEDLRLFDAAASSGSMSAGAKALGMSQPQMSRRLRDLEDTIGARLFDRTPQGLRPTAAGARLIPLAENMRRAADVIIRAKPDLATQDVSVVRLSVDEIRANFLVSKLADLRKSLPDIELEIFSGHEHLDHESRMTDIQVRSCLPDSETLIAKRVGAMSYGLYGSETFVAAHRCLDPLTNLSTLPWIGISPDHLWYPLQKRWLEEAFVQSSALRFNMMTDIAHAAQHGNGLALLPHFMAEEYPSLVEVPQGNEALLTIEYLIVHRDLLRENSVRRTVDAVTSIYNMHKNFLARNSSPKPREESNMDGECR